MKRVAILLIALLAAACGDKEAAPIATTVPVPTFTATPLPPTATPEPVLLVPTDTPVAVKALELATAAAAPTGPVCDCSGDLYKCASFDSQAAAQACFDYCKAQGAGDIHRLDQDNDGNVCESLR